jgi:DNA-binding NarL/FixJ family response regulator
MTRTKGKTKSDYDEPHWVDNGCAFEPSCVDCVRDLSECPDMVPRMKQKVRKERKREAIMALRADGLTNKEIAEAMKISERTVARAIGGE